MTDEHLDDLLEQEEVGFENTIEIYESPLIDAVVEKDIGGNSAETYQIEEPTTNVGTDQPQASTQEENSEEPAPNSGDPNEEPEDEYTDHADDLPPQEINPTPPTETEPEFEELSTEAAKLAANSFIGMTDNGLSLGWGMAVTIKKHKDLIEFDEVIQIIDHQNEQNLQRMRLTPEEKAMLEPLLIQVFKKRALKVSPERQLIGLSISILAAKLQLMFRIRQENDLLLERILQIVKNERQADQTSQPTNQKEPVEAETEAN